MKRKLDNNALLAPSARAYHPHFADVCILKGHSIDPFHQMQKTKSYISKADAKRMEIKLALAKGARILPVI